MLLCFDEYPSDPSTPAYALVLGTAAYFVSVLRNIPVLCSDKYPSDPRLVGYIVLLLYVLFFLYMLHRCLRPIGYAARCTRAMAHSGDSAEVSCAVCPYAAKTPAEKMQSATWAIGGSARAAPRAEQS